METAAKGPCHTGRNLKGFDGYGKEVLPNFLLTVREHSKPPFMAANQQNTIFIQKKVVSTHSEDILSLSLEVLEYHEERYIGDWQCL